MSSSGFFEFRARREESADLARNRASRRSRTPTRGREHKREIPELGKFGVDARNEMVQRKNRRDLIRGRSSVSRAGVRAYTFVRVFGNEYVFCWFFSNYVEDYLKFPKTLKLMHKSPTNVLPSVHSYQIRF